MTVDVDTIRLRGRVKDAAVINRLSSMNVRRLFDHSGRGSRGIGWCLSLARTNCGPACGSVST